MMSETKQEKLSAQVSKHDESIKTNADGSPENTKRNEKVIYSKSNDIYPETEAKTVGVLASDDRDEQHNDRLEFTDEGQMFPRMSPSPFKKSTSTQHLSLMEGQPADKDDEHENIKAEDFDWVNVGPEHGDGVEAKDAQVSNGTRNDVSTLCLLHSLYHFHVPHCLILMFVSSLKRPYGEESSFALFNHSFDISENGNYIRETNHQNENDIFSLSSPACSEKPITGGLLTPKLDITLPDLEQDDTSECSIVDISPIKVVQRASATSKSSHEIVHERSGDAHLRYTSGTPLTLNQKHGTAQTQQPNYQRKNMQLQHQTHQHQTYPRNFNLKSNYGQSYSQFSYPMENQAPISNPYFVIRSSQRAFAGFNYLLPCIRDSDLVSVNVSQHGHIHHFQEPEVSFCVSLLDKTSKIPCI